MVLSVLALAVGGWPPRAWAQGEFFQTNSANNSVTVYAGTASGDTAPLRTLQGASTGLSFPGGIALDLTHDELVVTNLNNSVTVYARTASGDTAPLRTLQGGNMGLIPTGLALDLTHDELRVANSGYNSVTVYARTASGNTAPPHPPGGQYGGWPTPVSSRLLRLQ